MQHSINRIAEDYADISERRKDVNRFVAKIFVDFAKANINKYSLVASGEDLVVSTWYSSNLIEDYRKTIE